MKVYKSPPASSVRPVKPRAESKAEASEAARASSISRESVTLLESEFASLGRAQEAAPGTDRNRRSTKKTGIDRGETQLLRTINDEVVQVHIDCASAVGDVDRPESRRFSN